MPNGDNSSLWRSIEKVQDDVQNLARDGCGHKEWHEKVSEAIRQDLVSERKDREKMGEKLFKKLDTLMAMVLGALGGIIVILLKSYLPVILGK